MTGWLGDPARLPGARVTNLQAPEFSGFSSEMLMVDVEHGGVTESLAVRVAPLHYQVFTIMSSGTWEATCSCHP